MNYRRAYKETPPEVRSERLLNKDRVFSVFKDAGVGVELSGIEVEKRTGIKNPYEYLRLLAVRGELVRVRQGIYTLPSVGVAEAIDVGSSIDECVAEDIRADERRRIAALLPEALRDAVPKDAEAYLQGFKDGAAFVVERVLGETLEEKDSIPQ